MEEYYETPGKLKGKEKKHLPKLEDGMKCYRIYIDLKPGYKLQAVFGNMKHELVLGATENLFNSDGGTASGDRMDERRFLVDPIHTVDSWVTMGAASRQSFGILKSTDDHSIWSEFLKPAKVDGDHIPIQNADGLLDGVVPSMTLSGLDLLEFVHSSEVDALRTNNGAFATLQGVEGPTDDNVILIAQITTTGQPLFELNLQVGTPEGGYEQYVAKKYKTHDITHEDLIFPRPDSTSMHTIQD